MLSNILLPCAALDCHLAIGQAGSGLAPQLPYWQQSLLESVPVGKVTGRALNEAGACLQGPAFGTSASVYDKQRVVATASGPTFATEDKTVHILLLTGTVSFLKALHLVPAVILQL